MDPGAALGAYNVNFIQVFEGSEDAAFDSFSLAAVIAGYQALTGLTPAEVTPRELSKLRAPSCLALVHPPTCVPCTGDWQL